MDSKEDDQRDEQVELHIKSEVKEEDFDNADPFCRPDLNIVKPELCGNLTSVTGTYSFEELEDYNSVPVKGRYSVLFPPIPETVPLLSDSRVCQDGQQSEERKLSEYSSNRMSEQQRNASCNTTQIISENSAEVIQVTTAVPLKPLPHNINDGVVMDLSCEGKQYESQQTFIHDEKITISSKNETISERYQCSQCCKSYKLRRSLKRHERIHAAETVINTSLSEDAEVAAVPNFCGAILPKASPVSNRRKTILFRCEFCPKQFTEADRVRSHTMRVHPDTIEGGKAAIFKYKCSWCSNTFFTRSERAQHERVHTGEKRFSCPHCSQKFSRKDYLRKHELRKHSRAMNGQNGVVPKDHKCRYCGKAFFQKYSLQIHEKIHTGANPYPCDFCGMKFRALYDKTKHETNAHIHGSNSGKGFDCGVCSSKFGSRAELRGHKNSHKGEKRFKCEYCSKRFVRKRALELHCQKHVNSLASEEQVSCKVINGDGIPNMSSEELPSVEILERIVEI